MSGRKEMDKLGAAIRRRFGGKDIYSNVSLSDIKYSSHAGGNSVEEFNVNVFVKDANANTIGTLVIQGDFEHCRREIELAELREES